jgi:hypothetical protein
MVGSLSRLYTLTSNLQPKPVSKTDLNTGLMWQKTPGDKVTYAEAIAGADSFLEVTPESEIVWAYDYEGELFRGTRYASDYPGLPD